MNDFALVPRSDLLNFKRHTVTNGTDLRKSPPHMNDIHHGPVVIVLKTLGRVAENKVGGRTTFVIFSLKLSCIS